MFRTYTLPKKKIANIETFEGIDIVHGAIVETDEFNKNAIVTMDTTDAEHSALSALGAFRDATQQEISQCPTPSMAEKPINIKKLKQILKVKGIITSESDIE